MRGLVTITKVYDDGRREVVVDNEENTLTHGFGTALATILTKGRDANLDDFRIGYLQLGTSSYYPKQGWDEELDDGIRKNFYSLHSPLLTRDDYGKDTKLNVVRRKCTKLATNFVPDRDLSFQKEFRWLIDATEVLPPIWNSEGFEEEQTNLAGLTGTGNTRYYATGINFKFVLDEDSCPDKKIREMGLYIRNQEERPGEDEPSLVAYKSVDLDQPLVKQKGVTLEIQWVIEFFDSIRRSAGVSRCITWGATKKERLRNDHPSFNVIHIEAGDVYDLRLNCPNGTRTGGVLSFEVFGESNDIDEYDERFFYGKRGTHWAFVDSNGSDITSQYVGLGDDTGFITFDPGDTYKTLTFSAIDNEYFHFPCTIRFRMLNYTGDKSVPDEDLDNISNEFIVKIRPKKDPFRIKFAGAGSLDLSCGHTDPTAKTGTNLFAYIRLVHDGPYTLSSEGDVSRAYEVGSPETSPTDTNYVRYHKIPIPEGKQDGDTISIDLTTTATVNFEARIYNNPSNVPIYNLNDNSNDLRPYHQKFKDRGKLTYQDILDNSSVLAYRPFCEFYKKNVMGALVSLDGWPTSNINSGYDIFTNTPSQDIYSPGFICNGSTMGSLRRTTPDNNEWAQCFYNSPLLWCWPDTTNGTNFVKFHLTSSKMRIAQGASETNSLGDSNGAPDPLLRYKPEYETAVYSCYIKNLAYDASSWNTVITDKSKVVPVDVSSNNVFAMTIIRMWEIRLTQE